MQDIDQLLKIISYVPERNDAVLRLLELLPEESIYRERFSRFI
jgi:hypothetical protein